jgi:uncharacterized membrane protein YgcG
LKTGKSHALMNARTLFALAIGGYCSLAWAEPDVPTSQPAVIMKSADRLELHFSEAPLPIALRQLSTSSHKNIIASAGVQGTVTADLFDVTFKEALESILAPNGCTFVQQGNFIHVYTLKEMSDADAANNSHKLTARLFHLNYVSTQDVEPMVKALLSTEGKIATMPEAAKAGGQTNGTSGGGTSGGSSSGGGGADGSSMQLGQGNLLSRPDAIMVCDYPDRIAQIDAAGL